MLNPLIYTDHIINALKEDLGHGHDITTQSLIDADATMTAVVRAREEGRVAGLSVARDAFLAFNPDLSVEILTQDGVKITKGDEVLRVSGQAQSILTAERVALNFLSHMTGIASETAKYVAAVEGTGAKIVDTRKTLPNLRALQKYAVKMGGGHNHRFGLDDAILIKDNHIAAAGSIHNVLNRAAQTGHMVKIEIEVDTLDQLQQVIDHKESNPKSADIVLLDNMTPETLKQAVEMIDGRLTTEASGGVNLDTVTAIAQSGVDLISIGALTHSVKVFDFGLDIPTS